MNIFWVRWLSLLSLDAVLVALAWQEVLARASHVPLSWHERALLGISVWMIYILDHLLDGNIAGIASTGGIGGKLKTSHQAPRHDFIGKHRSFFFSAITLGLFIDALLVLHISFPLLVAGGLLILVTSLYLFLNTFLLACGIWPRGKEIVISLIFTLGCGVVPLVQTDECTILVFSMIGLFLLNSINCTLIARLERGVAITDLPRHLIPSPAWIVPCGLILLLLNHLGSHSPIATAFLGSLMGLSLIPKIAKYCGYEMASLATDGVLVLGATLSFF